MRTRLLYLPLFLLPLAAFSIEPQVQIQRRAVSTKVPQKIVPPSSSTQQPVEKPDLTVTGITAYTQRGGTILGHVRKLYVNEPLELDTTIENVFAYDGHSRKKFKITVQFRYGYSGPVHKEKTIWVTKNLEPGESITQHMIYGRVKNTPDVLYVKVIADAGHAIAERNENNNADELEIRVEARP